MLAYESSYSFCHNSNSSMLFGIEHIDFAFLSIFLCNFCQSNQIMSQKRHTKLQLILFLQMQ